MKASKQVSPIKTSLTFNEFCRGITGPLDSVGASVHLKITENNHTIATIYNSSAHPESWSFQRYHERTLTKEIRSIYNNIKASGENLNLLIVRTDLKKPNLVLSFKNDNHMSPNPKHTPSF